MAVLMLFSLKYIFIRLSTEKEQQQFISVVDKKREMCIFMWNVEIYKYKLGRALLSLIVSVLTCV
jgi:hypothetical protein